MSTDPFTDSPSQPVFASRNASVVNSCPICSFRNHKLYRVCPECEFPLMLVAGKYKLEKKLAEGGMGEIYQASHTNLDYDAERVIKIIRPEFITNINLVKRFRREVQVTAALSRRNAHIVRIYDDFGEEQDLGFFFVMEFLEGCTLAQYLAKRQEVSERWVFQIFYQVCIAINVAHKEQVIHRDIKPDNIFLVHNLPQSEFVKILDFGIAKPIKWTRSETSKLTKGALGTPAYMSPEQCDKGEVDERSDIYSLAIVLYEMLTGHHPLPGVDDAIKARTPLPIIVAHIAHPPIPLQHWRPELPEALSQVLMKAMEKERAFRFKNVESFWGALARAVASEFSLPDLDESIIPQSTKDYGAYRTSDYDGVISEPSFSPSNTTPMGIQDTIVEPIDVTKTILEHPPYVVDEAKEEVDESEFYISNHRKTIWLINVILCVVLLLELYAVGFFSKRNSASHVAKAPSKAASSLPGKSSVFTKRTIPVRRQIVLAPSVTRKNKPRQRVVKVRAKVKQPNPSVKRRKRRAYRRRPVKYRPVVSVCGRSQAGWRWVWGRLNKPRRAKPSVSFMGCRQCKVRRYRGGICLWVPSQTTQVQISVSGYQTCVHRIKPNVRSLRWRLRIEDSDSLVDSNYPCIAAKQ